MSKSTDLRPKPRSSLLSARLGLVGLTALGAAVSLSTGCLQRPIERTTPETNNVFVEQYQNTAITQIDLLFMIDNSRSMADKQTVLALAVPQLLAQLVNPRCIKPRPSVKSDGTPETDATPLDAKVMTSPTEACDVANGYKREFNPVNDIHIGIVTSSIGSVASGVCPEDVENTNDKGWLIGALPRGKAASGTGAPFLTWKPANPKDVSAAQIDDSKAQFKSFVTSAGEVGCGYEAILEAWYRFLVNPKPSARIDRSIKDAVDSAFESKDLDLELLKQRAQFLRAGSLVAVIMLADENDASFRQYGVAAYVQSALAGAMTRASSACDTNPNDPCCYNCSVLLPDANGVQPPPPAGCSADPICRGGTANLGEMADQPNLRAFDEKRRYGYDFLYPTSRYVVGLTARELCPDSDYGDMDCSCAAAKAVGVGCNAHTETKVPNPLYSVLDKQDTSSPRADSSMVFLAGIVGVPWQLIATEDSQAAGKPLQFKLAAALDWGKIVGDRAKNKLPGDPHMIETPELRKGLQGPDAGLMADPIHGHDYNTIGGQGLDDLQYACIFPLPASKDCGPCPAGTKETDTACSDFRLSCDCTDALTDKRKKPLCQDPTGAITTVQYYAKAYPGIRQLEVLRDFNTTSVGQNSIVASICPKTLAGDSQDPGYGYNPAVASIIQRLKEKLSGRCLSRSLEPDKATGKLPCSIVEALKEGSPSCNNCAASGREEVDDVLAEPVRRELAKAMVCDVLDRPACSSMCLCKIGQSTGTDLKACQNEGEAVLNGLKPGYCYVDPAKGIGSPDLVATCPPTEKRLLRFAGKSVPAPNSYTFIACAGAAYKE